MWLLLIGIIGSIALALFTLLKYYTGNKGFWPKHNVFFLDMDTVVPFWDRMSLKVPFHVTEHEMYKSLKSRGVRDFGGVMEFRSPVLVAVGLDFIKNITVKDFDHFVNRRKFNPAGSDPDVHEMLLNKEDQAWRDLRSTLSPAFTTGKLRRMFQVFNESGNKLVKFLEVEMLKSEDNNGIDVRDCMTRFTLDVIASTAFGVDSQVFVDKNSQFSTSTTKLQAQFSGLKVLKVFIAIFAPKLLNVLGIQLADKDAMGFFKGVIQLTIRHRETSGEKRNDFVQLLIDAKAGNLKVDEDDQDNLSVHDKNAEVKKAGKTPLTDKLILSQALLFFFAGFDTVETLLIFAIYELGLNQNVQETLFQEIDKVMSETDGNLDYDSINRMEYLDKVVSETLRKYPPAIRTERQCTLDYKLPNSDFVIKKGQLVIIPMYGIHHDEEYYPEPEKFDPERFSPENKASRHPYAYMPFGTGPRSCIATRFALIEGKAALVHLVHKFRIEPSGKTEIPIKCGRATGLKPGDGMWLKLTIRS